MAGGAHWLVPVDGEGLCGDGVLALVAAEAIAMPFHIHGHHRRIRDGLLAFGAPGGEEVLVVLLAVGLAVLLVERLIGQRLLAGSAATEAFLVPTLAHGADGPLEDGLLAAGTGGGVPLHEALVAHRLSALDVEGGVHDLFFAVAAQEVLRMPRLPQRGDHSLGDGLFALVAHNVFGHLGYGIVICGER